MKSVILVSDSARKGLRAELAEQGVPTPGPGEVRVKMGACGLCGTDLEKIRGEYTASLPTIGHEAVGTVSEVGEGVDSLRVGDRVFPHHHVPCYSCYLCRSGHETMCEKYRSTSLVPGGFSEEFKVPAWNVAGGGVLLLPSGMEFGVASLVEPLACCSRGLSRCNILPGSSVLIAGAGPVGMMHALLLKGMGAEAILSDVAESRLAFAEKEGAGKVVDAARDDVPAFVKASTGGHGADVAIVASGSRAAILQGLRSIRRGGTLCLFGVPPKGTVLDYDISDLYNSEQQVFTTYGATDADTRDALRVLSERGGEFSRLITHRFQLSRFEEALEAAYSARAMKVVVTP